jgi:hypothetical protein
MQTLLQEKREAGAGRDPKRVEEGRASRSDGRIVSAATNQSQSFVPHSVGAASTNRAESARFVHVRRL